MGSYIGQEEHQYRQVGLIVTVIGGVLIFMAWGMLGAESFSGRFFSVFATLSQILGWNLRPLGFDLLVRGGICVVFGTAMFSRCGPSPSVKLFKLLPWLVGLLILFICIPIILFAMSDVVEGTRYWFLLDDQMISMRYGRNLANGLGLVWNANERVEGFTNLLWTLYMALVHLLQIPFSKTSLVLLFTSLATSLCVIPYMIGLVRILNGGRAAEAATLFGWGLAQMTIFWSVVGAETTFLALLFTASTYRVIRETKSNEPSVVTYLLIGLMTLVRADAFVLAALLCVAAIVLSKRPVRILVLCAVTAGVFLGQSIFRLLYYEEILPNTAYLKVMGHRDLFWMGLDYFKGFALNYMAIIGALLFGVLFSRNIIRTCLFLLLSVYASWVIIVGGDCFPMFRFFVPVLPLLMALSFVSIEFVISKPAFQSAVALLCVMATPLAIAPSFLAWTFNPAPGEHDSGNLKIGLWLKANTLPHSKVADHWAGTVFYFSERYGVDLLGKSDTFIARLASNLHHGIPGHTKFDYNYSLATKQPDFVVGTFKIGTDETLIRELLKGPYPHTSLFWFHPVFRKHCLPYPVVTDFWRPVFVCDWSPQFQSFYPLDFGARNKGAQSNRGDL